MEGAWEFALRSIRHRGDLGAKAALRIASFAAVREGNWKGVRDTAAQLRIRSSRIE